MATADYNIQELFRTAKDRLDIKQVAQTYGLQIERSGKALCPFHSDTHPSMSFKGQYFKCFSCGTGGDVFKLAGQLLGISKPIDVLKQLNQDFYLGLNIGGKLSRSEREQIKLNQEQREHKKMLEQAFKEWCYSALLTCTSYAKLLRLWQIEYAPVHETQEPHPLFIESMQNLSRVEHLCECLTMGDRAEQESFYKLCRNEVKLIEQRIREHNRNKAC